jgi:prepilin-type N-terminal cleavage/methylation domain-containing protein
MTRKQHPGFTLTELLLVTATLAILAAILLVTAEPARRMARVTTCTSHLRQIGIAYKMYLADYGQYPEPSQFTGSDYLNDRRILFCPEDVSFVTAGAATSYRFRADLPPHFLPLAQFHEVDPNVVLASCQHHLVGRVATLASDMASRSPAYPYHLILRADGRVERIHVSRIRKLLQPGSRPTVTTVYPGEPGYEEAERS